MQVCKSCGAIFDDGDSVVIKDYECEFWGHRVHETWAGCPECGSTDLTDADQCKVCGDYFAPGEIGGHVCDCCAEELRDTYKNDFETCYHLCEDEPKEGAKINGFLRSMFSDSEIEQILLDFLKNDSERRPVDCTEFIDGDLDWFIEKIAKGVKA